MKRVTLSFLLLFSTGLFTCIQAQLSGWSYAVPVQAIENTGATRYNYQVLLRIDTQTPIGQGKMQAAGEDIRFADACGFHLYDYWIEDYLNTDTTAIWVKLDSIPAGDTAHFYLFYGNGSASTVSDFSTTFPAAIVTGGVDVALTGNQNPGWLQVDAGDTLFVGAGDSLVIHARKSIINGVVWGRGRGYQPGIPNSVGAGPGGGGYSVPLNSGAGGGAYGGSGGSGGYDLGDSPGVGGTAYGTPAGGDINMGSAGGSSDNTPGGAGGGAFVLYSEIMMLTGKVDLSGADGTPPGGPRGGGGGAGGGLKLKGRFVKLSGANLSAIGGNGSVGTNTANDSGGGGGGGRIKSFYSSFAAPAISTANGGTGGPYGAAAPGQPGGNGTVSSVQESFIDLSTVIGNETSVTPPLPLTLSFSDSDLVLCFNDTLIVTAAGGYSNYDFLLSGASVQNGTNDVCLFPLLTSGDVITVIATQDGCVVADSATPTVTGTPVAISPSSIVACNGNPAFLYATAGMNSYLWSNAASAPAISVTTGGTYTVTATDTDGCVSSASASLTDGNFTATITPNDTTWCEGETITLTAGGASGTFAWNTSATTSSIDVTSSNTYSVTVTNSNGCTDDESLTITFSPAPNPVISVAGNNLSVAPSFPGYQWFFNGNPAGTAQTLDGSTLGSGQYVVVVTDANGCTGSDTTSFTLGSPEASGNLPAFVFPNPATDEINLSFTAPLSGSYSFTLLNVEGKVLTERSVMMAAGENRETMDVSQLASGVYLLKVTGPGAWATLRVAKR